MKKMDYENYNDSRSTMTLEGYEVILGETVEGRNFTEIRDHRYKLSEALEPSFIESFLWALEFPLFSIPSGIRANAAGANILETIAISMVPQALTYFGMSAGRVFRHILRKEGYDTIKRHPKIIGRKIEGHGKDFGEHTKTHIGL